MEELGIQTTDKRLAGFTTYLETIGGLHENYELKVEEFANAISTFNTLFSRIICGKLRVPNFQEFQKVIEDVYREVEPNTSGANATYIP